MVFVDLGNSCYTRDVKDSFGRVWTLTFCKGSNWDNTSVNVVLTYPVPKSGDSPHAPMVSSDGRVTEAVWFDEEAWREMGKVMSYKFIKNAKVKN